MFDVTCVDSFHCQWDVRGLVTWSATFNRVIHQVACYNQLPRVNTVGHAFLYSEIDAYVISVIYVTELYYIIIQDDNACV